MNKDPFYPNQIVPLFLTIIVFFGGILVLLVEALLLNKLTISREAIMIEAHWPDILVGLTIYLKTSIDFAIYIGRLMSKFPGWKNRIMIEIGTALGNILGTLIILLIWDIFREVKPLMAIMIVIAAFVLLRLAEEGLEHVKDEEGNYHVKFLGIEIWLEKGLHAINSAVAPFLNILVPKTQVKEEDGVGYKQLFMLAFSVPFILGLDDFAGYIPLFNIINVIGFAIGVFGGHMLLNIALFMSPKRTIRIVKNPIISFLGSIAFVGLAVWGMVEAYHLVF